MKQSSTRSTPVWRGIIVGLIAVPVVCFAVSWAELVLMTLQVGYLQMPPAVIALLLVGVALNAAVKSALGRRIALSAQELLIAYAMMVVAAMVSSRGLIEKLIPLLVAPNYFADSSNDWRNLYFSHIRQYLVHFDVKGAEKQDIAVRLFEKLRAGETIPWSVWIAPVAIWSVLALCIFGAFFFLAALLRRQWVENEKLSFPLVQLPLEMAGAGDAREVSFLKNGLTWFGFSIPMVIFLFKGLHSWYPSVPDIPLEIALNDYFTTPPWNGIYYTPLKLSFAILGFLYLLPSDLLFSLWFFFVLSRVQDIIARAANMDMPAMPMYPTPLYRGYQAMGAYLVMAVYLLWLARPHLRTIWRAVLGRDEARNEADELLPYRWAFWGFWACFFGAALFLVLVVGISPLLALLQLVGLFFVISLVMARSTAEAGMLMTETSFRPIDLVRLFVPLHVLGPANLTGLAFTDALLLRDQRSLLLGGFLDGLRLADGVREMDDIAAVRRRFAAAMAVAVVFAIVVAAGIQIALPYRRGGLSLYGYVYQGNDRWSFDDYQQYFRTGSPGTGWQGPVFLIVGLVVTMILVFCRTTLSWFPLHPLGYALCSSWTMIVFWFSAFLAWLLKSLILRYGGMRLYRQARPLFLGMILGEFTAALLWTVANACLDTPVPPFTWA